MDDPDPPEAADAAADPPPDADAGLPRLGPAPLTPPRPGGGLRRNADRREPPAGGRDSFAFRFPRQTIRLSFPTVQSGDSSQRRTPHPLPPNRRVSMFDRRLPFPVKSPPPSRPRRALPSPPPAPADAAAADRLALARHGQRLRTTTPSPVNDPTPDTTTEGVSGVLGVQPMLPRQPRRAARSAAAPTPPTAPTARRRHSRQPRPPATRCTSAPTPSQQPPARTSRSRTTTATWTCASTRCTSITPASSRTGHGRSTSPCSATAGDLETRGRRGPLPLACSTTGLAPSCSAAPAGTTPTSTRRL